MTRIDMERTAAVAGAVILAGALAGCGPKMHPAVREARAAYEETARNPEIAEHAPVKLHEAEQALQAAETDWKDDGSADEARHDAYVVRQKLEVARATAQEKIHQGATRDVARSRSEILLEARERELAELRARQTERGLEITLGDVLFEFDKARLKPGAARLMDKLVAVLEEDPSRQVTIEGHTDAVGSDSYNRELSEARASAVRDYLVQRGVDARRIVARGYGEAYPVASNDTDAGRQQNRRVDVVILNRGESASRTRPDPLTRR